MPDNVEGLFNGLWMLGEDISIFLFKGANV